MYLPSVSKIKYSVAFKACIQSTISQAMVNSIYLKAGDRKNTILQDRIFFQGGQTRAFDTSSPRLPLPTQKEEMHIPHRPPPPSPLLLSTQVSTTTTTTTFRRVPLTLLLLVKQLVICLKQSEKLNKYKLTGLNQHSRVLLPQEGKKNPSFVLLFSLLLGIMTFKHPRLLCLTCKENQGYNNDHFGKWVS